MGVLARSKPTVCVTLDGFLARINPRKPRAVIGEPLPGVAELMQRLGTLATIVVYSSRINVSINPDRPELEQLYAVRDRVKHWLDTHQVWYDDIWIGQGKPIASLYIGPRCVDTGLNPTPDDFVGVENEIRERLSNG